MRLQSNVFGVQASVVCSQSRYGACAAPAEMPSPLNFRRERRRLLSSEHAQNNPQPARRVNGCLRPLTKRRGRILLAAGTCIWKEQSCAARAATPAWPTCSHAQALSLSTMAQSLNYRWRCVFQCELAQCVTYCFQYVCWMNRGGYFELSNILN